jgi:hypothetical protein
MQIEHRLLCQVMVDRQGRPAEIYRVVVQSIGPGGPEQVLELHESWNQSAPRRNKRSAALRKTPPNLQPAVFQPLWNYTIKPAAKPHA